MGYEALDDDVKTRVLPDDPLSVEEVWLCFEPDSESLDCSLGEALPVLAERYGAEGEYAALVARDRPLFRTARALDYLLGKVVSAL